jgi:putative ABC transport system permease protein
MSLVHLIWSNLRRRKLRTLLTASSILVAFVLYGYLSAIREAFGAGVNLAGADRLIVRHKVSLIQPLPQSYKQRIARIDGVALATHATWFGAIYQDPKNFFGQMPVIPEEFLSLYPEFVLPDDQKAAWLATRTGAIVGRTTAKKFEWKIGDRIPLKATIWPPKKGGVIWEFDLVGIYDATKEGVDLSNFYFRHDYFDENRQFGEGQVGWYIVRVKDPNRAAEVAAAIDAEFSNSSAETKAETEGAFVRAFAKQMGDIALITMAILLAVFFTILLVSGNTMAQAVRERTEELGVLKAIGFTNLKVLVLVLAESCLIALLGGGLGLLLAWSLIARGDPTGGALPTFHFPKQELALGLVYALGLGLVAGLFPAWQAMRLRIADALRRN